MNREIKFRGKRIDNDEWVYGYLHFEFNCTDEYVPFISWKDSSYLEDIGEEEINIKTIGQYTGLHDKNGKEIYKGDIAKYENMTGKIMFFNGSFIMSDFEETEEWELGVINAETEVIGNIYDNPELLKGE